jgi:hypothetical protein
MFLPDLFYLGFDGSWVKPNLLAILEAGSPKSSLNLSHSFLNSGGTGGFLILFAIVFLL